VKSITHYNDLPTPVHESLWYTNDEWSAMESKNMREVYEEQVAAEYGYAELTPHGYYEYIDQPAEDLDDLNDDDDDDDDQGSGDFLGDETDNDNEVDQQHYSETNERRETGDSAAGDGSDDNEDDDGLFVGADSDAEDDDDDDAEVIDEVFKPGLMSGIRGIRH
jgi:hypothetical protein